jgi:hypothetical protein
VKESKFSLVIRYKSRKSYVVVPTVQPVNRTRVHIEKKIPVCLQIMNVGLLHFFSGICLGTIFIRFQNKILTVIAISKSVS